MLITREPFVRVLMTKRTRGSISVHMIEFLPEWEVYVHETPKDLIGAVAWNGKTIRQGTSSVAWPLLPEAQLVSHHLEDNQEIDQLTNPCTQ